MFSTINADQMARLKQVLPKSIEVDLDDFMMPTSICATCVRRASDQECNCKWAICLRKRQQPDDRRPVSASTRSCPGVSNCDICSTAALSHVKQQKRIVKRKQEAVDKENNPSAQQPTRSVVSAEIWASAAAGTTQSSRQNVLQNELRSIHQICNCMHTR